MTSPLPPGRRTAALLLAALLASVPAVAEEAETSEAVSTGPHPAIAHRLAQEQPLPWVFALFQRGNLATVDRESRFLLESLLRDAAPGSTVRIASQRWDRYWNRGAERPLAALPLDRYTGPDCWPALAEAVNRGVDVAVVQNGRGAKDSVVAWLRDPSAASTCPVTPAAERGQTRVKVCTRPPGKDGGGCLGDGQMRASFFTFERVVVEGQELSDIVAITGASYGNRQLHEQNDWVVVVGDPLLYEALNQYFEAMFSAANDAPETGWQGIPDGEGFRLDAAGATRSAASTAADGAPAITLAFHPRSDFVEVDALKQVECDPTARIRILMTHPPDEPGAAPLLDAARRLGRAGCQVEALVREKSEKESEALIERVAADGVSVVAVPKVSGVFFNSRYVLIDAKIGGKRRRLVYTGGASFDPARASRDEEILVGIEHDEVFRSYDRQIDLMCKRLNCRIPPAR